VRAIELRATFTGERNALRKASELESTLVVRGSRGEFLIRVEEPEAVVKEARRIVEIIRRASEASKDFK
jgi:glycerol-3-phosphate cytidylyltransferase-like family protein